MNIFYIGSNKVSSTSYHRAMALKRLENAIFFFNPENYLTKNKYLSFFNYRTGFKFTAKRILNALKEKVDDLDYFDLIWVDSGEWIDISIINYLKKKFNKPIILYNIDDPTGRRDRYRFRTLKKTLPHFDLIVVVREETKMECYDLGAKNVMKVWRSYDEIAHHGNESLDLDNEFYSEIAFIGTWIRHEKRDEFLLKLIDAELPISIWGNRWQKSKLWSKLKNYYKGPALEGKDYVAAIQHAKICIGLLSKGNRDQHTTRSLEIPYIGGLLCAERTSEHLQLYKEDKEAVFWDNVDECIEKCHSLLANPDLINQIKANGRKRVFANKVGNEDICRQILEQVKLL